MKILIPTADYPPIEGGIATVALQVSRELARRGHDVTVVAPHFAGMEAFDRREGPRIVRFRGYGLGWFRFFPMLVAAWPYLRESDLILAINIAYGGLLGWLAKRIWQRPYVGFAYAYEFLKFRRIAPFAWLLRRIYVGARVVVAISAYTRGRLVAFGVPNSKMAVVLPGATPSEPCSAQTLADVRAKFALDGSRVILAVGRFVARKGHVTLVRALPKIIARFPNAVAVMVGRGPCMQVVTREAMTLGVRDHIILPGRLADEEVAALYELCEVFALPTGARKGGQVEGFGLVFAECHAHGKPVVAGRSGGVVDAVLEGETGLLVEPEDSEALSEAMISIMSDPAWARRLGENGRRRVEAELNWSTFTERLLEEVEARA
ncbi:MAG TPA: glycosyltransferase family 4 protein [Candidatus Hydrogenedentes bacterium]|nr:glycosyltransferase family 4 protein [Candidatus Hydrogenedentota bacterium]